MARSVFGPKTDVADSVWLARICPSMPATLVPPPAQGQPPASSSGTAPRTGSTRSSMRWGPACVLSDAFGVHGMRILEGIVPERRRGDPELPESAGPAALTVPTEPLPERGRRQAPGLTRLPGPDRSPHSPESTPGSSSSRATSSTAPPGPGCAPGESPLRQHHPARAIEGRARRRPHQGLPFDRQGPHGAPRQQAVATANKMLRKSGKPYQDPQTVRSHDGPQERAGSPCSIHPAAKPAA